MMNERIRELATQCIMNPYETRVGIEDFERFAELLIKDCIADVLLYSCTTINNTKETYLDGFIDGTEQGYKDAVEQIAEGLALRYGVK